MFFLITWYTFITKCLGYEVFMFYYIEEEPQSLFFDLIYKNASTDILNSLINYGDIDNNPQNSIFVHDNLPKNIIKINEDATFINNILTRKDLFKTTCLRDPYLRAVSCFVDKILNNRSTDVIKDFFDMYGKDIDVFRNDKVKYFDIFLDFIDQSDFNTIDSHLLPQSMTLKLKIQEYDKVFNVFTLYEEWSELTKIFPKIPNLPKKIINQSNSEDLLKILNKRGLDKVKKIYESDYEMLELL